MSITGSRAFNGRSFACDVLNAPIVTVAELNDVSHPININSESGKRRGAVVYVEIASGLLTTAVAQGANPDDDWAYIDPSSVGENSPVMQAMRDRIMTLESEYIQLQEQVQSLNLDNGGGG